MNKEQVNVQVGQAGPPAARSGAGRSACGLCKAEKGRKINKGQLNVQVGSVAAPGRPAATSGAGCSAWGQ